jgi:sarcosine oxidase
MSKAQSDVIILGLGAMGAAAAYHLAARGMSVIGIDRYQPGHRYGSSHGRTRIIREAYFEAPEYVPLVRRAYQLWRELENDSGRSLLSIHGVLTVGTTDSETVSGVLKSSERYGVACESLNRNEIIARFPGLMPAEDHVGVFEPTGGLLDPEASIDIYLEMARKYDAGIRDGERVRSWRTIGSGVEVVTDQDTYRADRLVITAGPWTNTLLPDLHLPLECWRVFFAHYDSVKRDYFTPDAFPITLWDTPDGMYYTIPYLPGQGVKVGRHDAGEVVDPETMKRTVDVSELRRQTEIIERYMPGSTGRVLEAETCIYTMTPDHHFIIDLHPEHENVSYACGFSGHGYKFAPVIGEVIADLAEHSRTEHPIGFLSAKRFATGAAATR